ncbi:hypothetical protein [Rhodococcus sp. 24CO]|uniref:hypothetical protein n=1 Tax=Rhodococcus sp. 24CO TaxID=3117460 RepID=UPI003D3541BF
MPVNEWPALESWPDLIAAARAFDREGWSKWRTSGAAARAARVTGSVVRRHKAVTPYMSNIEKG